MTESLTDNQWQIAHAIANSLVQDNTDANELGKAIAYLRAYVYQPNAGARFFTYLKTLVNNGNQMRHSNQTIEYYRNIEKACRQYLQSEQDNASSMLQILGWASRLMRYYKVTPVGESIGIPEVATPSTRQQEIAKVVKSHKFAVGQIIDAKVTNKTQGNKVTYEILGTIKLTIKEPKNYNSIPEGEIVKVEIFELKDDMPKKVKWVESVLENC